MRKSYSEKLKFKEETQSKRVSINTKCPSKWVFVDLETGDMWSASDVHPHRLFRTPVDKTEELRKIENER